MLAGLLAADQVMTAEGEHDWQTWRALWREACLHSDLFRPERSRRDSVSDKSDTARAVKGSQK